MLRAPADLPGVPQGQRRLRFPADRQPALRTRPAHRLLGRGVEQHRPRDRQPGGRRAAGRLVGVRRVEEERARPDDGRLLRPAATGTRYESSSSEPGTAATWPPAAGSCTGSSSCGSTTSAGFENLMVDLATDDPRAPRAHRHRRALQRGRRAQGARPRRERRSASPRTSACRPSLPGQPGDVAASSSSPPTRRPSASAATADPAGLPSQRRAHPRDHPRPHRRGRHAAQPADPRQRAGGAAEGAPGKVCLNQDLDRQLFPFATPSQIEDHVGEVFEGGLPEGRPDRCRPSAAPTCRSPTSRRSAGRSRGSANCRSRRRRGRRK